MPLDYFSLGKLTISLVLPEKLIMPSASLSQYAFCFPFPHHSLLSPGSEHSSGSTSHPTLRLAHRFRLVFMLGSSQSPLKAA